MSRYDLEPKDKENHSVVCGWDRPLGNFFLQVENTKADETSDDRMVEWLGADGNKTLTDVDKMLSVAGRYATVPDDLRGQLLEDQRAEPFRERLMTKFIDERNAKRQPDDSYRNAVSVGEHWQVAAKHYPHSKSHEDKSDDRDR